MVDKKRAGRVICNLLHISVQAQRGGRSFRQIAKVLRAAADHRRIRLLAALMRKELCVCELVDALVLPQYEVSRHLAALKTVGLVTDRREGLWAYYSIPDSARKDPLLGGLLDLIAAQTGAAREIQRDLARVERRLTLRAGGRCVVGAQG